MALSINKAETLATWALVGIGAFMALRIYQRGIAGAAADVVGVADAAAGGLIQGLGAAVGVPMTDAQKCVQAKAQGDMVGVSFYCAAADWAGTAGGRAVESVGAVFGVPVTNQTECERAMAEGRTLDASFACPAGDFMKYIFK